MKCPVCLTEQPPATICRSCGALLAALADAANPFAAPFAKSPLASGSTRHGPELASRSSRLGARIVDVALIFIALIPGFAFAAITEVDSDPTTDDRATGVKALGFLALCICQWTLLARDGQTLGKKAMGIKLVMYDDGSNPGFARAVIMRNWINSLFGCLPFYGLVDLLLILGEERRCIHDHLAGTKVIEVP